MSVEITLNGRSASLRSPPDSPLLWALRDERNLVGVKFGCGAGLCGACTVLVDGQQARACQTLVGDVAGKNVTTIEGLSGDVAKAVLALENATKWEAVSDQWAGARDAWVARMRGLAGG